MSNLSAFFSKTNLRFFECLLDGPLFIRQLAEQAGCSPAKASQSVQHFKKRGLVTTRKEKNKKIVSLNISHLLTREIISLLFTSKILSSKAFQALAKQSTAVGLYGSAAEGTLDAHSDIDVWVLTEKKLPLLVVGKLRHRLSQELGREVSLKAFTKKSMDALRQNDEVFFREIAFKSKMLHGEPIA